MRSLALVGLATTLLFLMLDAMVTQSSVLIYMSSVVATLIGVARLQRWYALSRLRIRRLAPATATVGDAVSVRFTINNAGMLRTPVLRIEESWLPRGPGPATAKGLDAPQHPDWMCGLESPPAFSTPSGRSVEVTYGYVPTRRGLFEATDVKVYSDDVFGLARGARSYPGAKGSLLVLPIPERVPLDLATVYGWGLAETESGQSEGGGIEPRGVREWQPGDSLRHIHWRSSARVSRLQVKQFEAGHIAEVVLVLDTHYTGPEPQPVFEKAIRNVAYVAREFITAGTSVSLVGQGIAGPVTESRRGLRHYQTILEALAAAKATSGDDIGTFVTTEASAIPMYSTAYVFTADVVGLRSAARAISARSSAPSGYLYGRRDSVALGFRVTPVDTSGTTT